MFTKSLPVLSRCVTLLTLPKASFARKVITPRIVRVHESHAGQNLESSLHQPVIDPHRKYDESLLHDDFLPGTLHIPSSLQ
jgi:hypothetical protein